MSTAPLSLKVSLALVIATAGLTACVNTEGGSTYAYHETGRINYVDYGTIEDVRRVRIRGGDSGIGSVTGAVIGGAIGSEIGEGDAANVIGVVGGAILGGIIGAAIEEDMAQDNGYEYTIRREDGMVFTVVQHADGPALRPGTRVRIIEGDHIRIVPEDDYRDHYYDDDHRDRRRDRRY